MATKKKNQARLRLIAVDGIRTDDPRRYSHSTSERSFSQRTAPPENRSMRMAKDSPERRVPYATFRKWPTVVLQSEANCSSFESERDFKKDIRSMPDYHHTVIERQPPFGEYTKWLPLVDNIRMEKNDVKALRDLRRLNLQRFLAREGLSQSALAKIYADYRSLYAPNAKPIKPSFFNDVLRAKNKSFGEKLASSIEKSVGLKQGELSKKDSLLEMEAPAATQEDEVLDFLQRMPPKKRTQLLERLSQAQKHRRPA